MANTVSVVVKIQDSAPKLTDFGTIAIFAKTPYATDPRTYSANGDGLAAMVVDGFEIWDEAYIMVQALAAQDTGQSEAKVYPRDAGNNAQIYQWTPTNLVVGTKYTLGLKGRAASLDAEYTVVTSDTATEIVDGLIAQIVAQTAAVVTGTEFADGTYTVRINKTDFSFVASTDTLPDILTGVAAAIDADARFTATSDATTITINEDSGKAVVITSVVSPVANDWVITTQGVGPAVGVWIDATNVSDVLQCVPKVAGDRFHVNEWTAHLTLADTSVDAGIATDLAAGKASDPDFYGILIDSTSPAEIDAANTFAVANSRMFVGMGVENSWGTNDDTDVAQTIFDANGLYGKTWYHKRTIQRADCAWMGRVFGNGPAYGWAWLVLQNITAPVVTPTFTGFLDDKGVGYIKKEQGESFTHNTKFPGRFPDLVRGFDWFSDRVKAAGIKVFLDAGAVGGVPFTDQGIGQFVGALYGEIPVAQTAGLLARDPAPQVVAVAAADVSALDKAARELIGTNAIILNATLAGKIESMAFEIIVVP